MGAMSIWQWLIILAIVLLLFGRGKISGLLGDLGQGIRAFKRGIADEPQELETVQANKTDGAPHA